MCSVSQLLLFAVLAERMMVISVFKPKGPPCAFGKASRWLGLGGPLAATKQTDTFFSKPDFGGPNGLFPPGVGSPEGKG